MAFLILPYGCERDEEIDISTKAKFNAPSITRAKHHVEQHTTLKLRDPNNFFQNRDLEGTLTVDWELSGIKEYKDEPEQQVDILYTPIYINNDTQAKMFVGSVEYNGEIKSNIFCLIYTDLENTTTFSGYILRFDLNGALLEARKYQNGSIVNPQDNTSEGMSRTNCDNETIFDMLIMLLDGGGSLSNWHGCLDTVVVYGSNTSIDAGDSTGGGSPLDSAIVTSINIPALETNSNNPAGLSVPYWYTQSVTANGFNISLWLEIHPLTPIAQWLMTEATTNQLQQIANFLNAHKFKIRDEFPLLNVDGSDGFEPADSPTASTGYAISEEAKLEIIVMIKLINGMDKDCQAMELFKSVYRINSTFTNKIKNHFLSSNQNNLNLQDLANGESVDNEPGMTANVGGRVLPEPSSDGTIIMQFNNDHLDTATTLGIVNTFYHELVHAYILSLFHSGQLLIEYPNYTNLNTAMTDFFNNSTNPSYANSYNQEMHNIFTDFIDQIAESIVSYADSNNINGVDLAFAKKLVWGGLNGNDIFFENLTPQQQNEAQTLLAHENTNNTSNAKGKKTCD